MVSIYFSFMGWELDFQLEKENVISLLSLFKNIIDFVKKVSFLFGYNLGLKALRFSSHKGMFGELFFVLSSLVFGQ